jgi:type IV pilus assembly protein PilP
MKHADRSSSLRLRSRRWAPPLFTVVTAVLVACGGNSGPATLSETAPPPPPRRGVQASLSAAISASAEATASPLSEGDFTPSDRNRDPFRSYVELFVKNQPTHDDKARSQQVVADRFALDELKLVGIITGATNPRAMFIDPEGKGWIVSLGQLVGRAESVKANGTNGAEYDLNWKVDRIRDGDVVFVRETPGRANVPGTTRVIALRTDNDPQARHR